MPTYNGRCDEHGEFEDIMKASEYLTQDGLYCPICRKKATTLIRKAPAIVGPLPSKTLHLDQIGQNFSSPEEQRAYFKQRAEDARVNRYVNNLSARDIYVKRLEDQLVNLTSFVTFNKLEKAVEEYKQKAKAINDKNKKT